MINELNAVIHDLEQQLVKQADRIMKYEKALNDMTGKYNNCGIELAKQAEQLKEANEVIEAVDTMDIIEAFNLVEPYLAKYKEKE